MITWAGPPVCDFCKRNLHNTKWFVDAPTYHGSWANMCRDCFFKYGDLYRLMGQLYRGIDFVKIGNIAEIGDLRLYDAKHF